MREKERKTIIHSGGNGRGEARGCSKLNCSATGAVKDLENGFKDWLAKQFLPVEAAFVIATSTAQDAAIGAFMGTLIHYACYVYGHMIFFHRVYNFINNNKNK